MSRVISAQLDEQCHALIALGSGTHKFGWVLHDGFLDSLDLWNQYLNQHHNLYLLNRLIGLGNPELPGIDLQPVAGQLGGTLPAYDPTEPTGSFFATLAQLRRLLSALTGIPILVIQQPVEVDDFSQRVLGALAQEGTLRLAIHLPPGSKLPARWRKMDESGHLVHCPVLSLPSHQINEVFDQASEIRLPQICAISVHQATGGEARILQALLESTDYQELKAALFTGRIAGLSMSQALANRLRLRRARLAPALRELLDLCAFAGHLPMTEARQLGGRSVLDELIASGMLRITQCAELPVVSFSASLISQYWVDSLSAYEQNHLRTLLATEAACCESRNINSWLTQLGKPNSLDTAKLCTLLDLACDKDQLAAAKRYAETLQERVGTIRSKQMYQIAVVSLAKYTALLAGPYPALRMLNSQNNIHSYDWNDRAGHALVVQQCLETGRLFPTVQRLAALLSLPIPKDHGDPKFWLLLPSDDLREHMRRGVQAALKTNLRAAAVHFVAGLRKCQAHPQRTNAGTLRGSFLTNAAVALALGGYHREWNILLSRLRDAPEAWHSQAAPAWHAAQGILQMQHGDLEDGRRTIVEAAALSQLGDRNNVWEGAHALEVWLDAQQLNAESLTAHTLFPLSEILGFGRSQLEETLNQALMREPEELAKVLCLADGLADPRGRAISLCAQAELGLQDPVRIMQLMKQLGQDFMALWLADGILLRRMFVHRGDLPIPQSRRTEDLLGFSAALIRRCESIELEPLDAKVVQILRTAPMQSLPVLPFAAHEAKRRKLTHRENQILELVQDGQSNREIARLLTVSIRTVEGHIAAILDKYALRSRALLSTNGSQVNSVLASA